MNGQYVYTNLGRKQNKEWGRSVYRNEWNMRRKYATERGLRAAEKEKARKKELEELEQKQLLEKYAHIPHVPPSS